MKDSLPGLKDLQTHKPASETFYGRLTGIVKLPLQSFAEFLAPRNCDVCGIRLPNQASELNYLCNDCLDAMPLAPQPSMIINSLLDYYEPDDFAITNILSLISRPENSAYMELIYSLKYRGFSNIGIELGKLLGKRLILNNLSGYDALIPVPIHIAKKRERGYNQSEFIAMGVADVLNSPVNVKIIKRKLYTESQTALTHEERKGNVENAFEPYRRDVNVRNMKFLVIDDVLTTGSTINSCAYKLLEMGAIQVDAATLVRA